MNPVLTILRHFCPTEGSRTELYDPFVMGDYAYASDGHLLIRCERKHAPELEPAISIPEFDMSRFNWDFMDDLRAHDNVPAAVRIGTWVAPEPCSYCMGYGSKIECPQCKVKPVEDCGVCNEMFWIGAPGGNICDECHGTGYRDDSHEVVALEGIELAGWAVRRVLSVLPGAWWRVEDESADGNPAGMTLIHFSSGIFRGVLAPLEKSTPVVRTVKNWR